MTIKLPDLIRETTTTTGTGTYSLAGAVTGFRSFSVVGNGAKTLYCCTDNNGTWEVGIGTVTTGSPNTLARTTVINGTNGTSAVNWGAGTKHIFATATSLIFNRFTLSSNYTAVTENIATGTNALSIGTGNTSSGGQSITIGYQNVASGSDTVCIGALNDATNTGAVATGYDTTASGVYSFTAAYQAIASGAYSAAFNYITEATQEASTAFGRYSKTRWPAEIALASGRRAASGDQQGHCLHVSCLTTNATQTDMKTNNAAWDVPTDSTMLFDAVITARQYGGASGTVGDSKAWSLKFAMKNIGGTTSLIGSATKTVIAADAAASAWDVAESATGNYRIKVTGEASKNISWSGMVRVAEAA